MQKMHCCNDMQFYLNENRVDINFSKKFREYSIGMKNGTSAIQLISYCSWCGSELPKGLSDKWFEILKTEYGLDDPYFEDADRVPEEFKADEWWKKRGL